MCGICGIWFKGTGRVPSRDLLTEMTDTLYHRGPDEGDVEIIGDLGFGHRRLKIIDLSTGQQPMGNEDGTVWVVFNGEIYNFQELRRNLEGKGHRFRSNSDTEVLVHLYEEHGSGMCEYLRGMFAFAIWDMPRQRLFLSRDRLGIKPLYYWDTAEFFAFSSELKTLLPLSRGPLPVVAEAVSDYFTFGYVPAPATPFAGIAKMEPAQQMEVDRYSLRTRTYWTPTASPEPVHNPEERLAELVDEAVRIRLVSDVPFGAFLSGGIDSSTVCAFMQRNLNVPLKSFSIGFPVERFNELDDAQKVASHLGTEHYSRMVTPDAISLLPKLAWHFDEPFADSSAIPTWYVSQLAREHVTMTHSGDGGDELFGGYTRYFKELNLQKYSAMPPGTLQSVNFILQIFGAKFSFINRLKRILDRVQLQPVERYRAAVGICVNPYESILRPELQGKTSGFFQRAFTAAGYQGGNVSLNALGLVDLKTYLPEDILTKVDRMSMAHSLEARVPLLDHKLVEFAMNLEASWKIGNDGSGKKILKELAYSMVPKAILDRPKKGFGVPLENWFRNDLKEIVLDLQASPNHPSYEWLDRNEVGHLVQQHLTGAFDHSERLWAVLMFQKWLETFVSGHKSYSYHWQG